MKRLFLLVILVLVATSLFSQEVVDKRGFYFGFGGGPALIRYPEPLESQLNDLETTVSGMTRIQMEIDITIGGAIKDNTYLVGSVSGFADRLDDSIDWMQFNTYLYGLGVRYYPFTTGLILGGDLGGTKMNIQNSSGINEDSDYSYGYNLIVAYDFDKTKTGFAFQLGVKVGGYDIEGEQVTGVALFGNLVWK